MKTINFKYYALFIAFFVTFKVEAINLNEIKAFNSNFFAPAVINVKNYTAKASLHSYKFIQNHRPLVYIMLGLTAFGIAGYLSSNFLNSFSKKPFDKTTKTNFNSKIQSLFSRDRFKIWSYNSLTTQLNPSITQAHNKKKETLEINEIGKFTISETQYFNLFEKKRNETTSYMINVYDSQGFIEQIQINDSNMTTLYYYKNLVTTYNNL